MVEDSPDYIGLGNMSGHCHVTRVLPTGGGGLGRGSPHLASLRPQGTDTGSVREDVQAAGDRTNHDARNAAQAFLAILIMLPPPQWGPAPMVESTVYCNVWLSPLTLFMGL